MESRIKFCVAVAVFIIVTEIASCHFVFEVQHKFAGKGKNLAHFKSHDTRRHSRMLASVDLPLGGDSRVDSVGLSLYDVNASSTSKKVGCDDDFCSFISNSDSCQPDLGCSYHIVYADQSTSEGNFIRDNLSLDQVTGNLLTGPLAQEVITSRQSVKLHIVEETFQCFTFTKDVNQAFPPVNFHFEDSLKLTVYPHDYLFSLESEMYCFGWQVGGMTTEDRSEVILLGEHIQ
ncbi:hypothetical protein HID58_022578 [Brassica napus]|uniref:Xylanase inhibitor N-terminal domain-containing protein n=1 Tax=Brassica napus TaxID=3708 RepID=A0ABQ8CZN5_BRANA|nr:hypothetical protein HID58_022578 [Brassica napus]